MEQGGRGGKHTDLFTHTTTDMVTVKGFSFSRVDCPQDDVFLVRVDLVNGNALSRHIHLPPNEVRGPGAADLRTKDTKRDLVEKFREETPSDLFIYTDALP